MPRARKLVFPGTSKVRFVCHITNMWSWNSNSNAAHWYHHSAGEISLPSTEKEIDGLLIRDQRRSDRGFIWRDKKVKGIGTYLMEKLWHSILPKACQGNLPPTSHLHDANSHSSNPIHLWFQSGWFALLLHRHRSRSHHDGSSRHTDVASSLLSPDLPIEADSQIPVPHLIRPMRKSRWGNRQAGRSHWLAAIETRPYLVNVASTLLMYLCQRPTSPQSWIGQLQVLR
jgi:hypothetical protein